MRQLVQSMMLFAIVVFTSVIGNAWGRVEPTNQMQRVHELDLKLASEIGRDILNNLDITPYGRDIGITAENGKVTLTGGVRTQAERKLLGSVAERHVAPDTVVNNLIVLWAE